MALQRSDEGRESKLLGLADEWIRLDPDMDTREEISKLVENENFEELARRLLGRISFGTAGLRARMEAGYTRMNCLTVIQTSQGLADYLNSTFQDVQERSVVIGRDARKNSDKFADAAAKAFAAMGITVHRFSEPVHTPLVPFAVRHLDAVAGIMITASHNPKEDNGYKVYWRNGCQIIPPHDANIAQAIDRIFFPSLPNVLDDNMFRSIGDHVQKQYFERVQEVTKLPLQLPAFVYTPLHGVGFRPFARAMNRILDKEWQPGDATPFVVVQEQQYPDPEFPTVKFPNPEERGALDLAMRTADANDISLIIANDPDADRLAVAEKITLPVMPHEDARSAKTSYWHQFTGNQVGVLLASHIFETLPAPSSDAAGKSAVLRSTVSTTMLDVMAERNDYHVQETLTGFKWLGNVTCDLAKKGVNVNFAFEEALGYMLPSIVLDKDGVSAGAMFLAATCRWREQSMTPWQRLLKLYHEYGCFFEANTYLKSPSSELTAHVFANIRSIERPFPSGFKAGIKISRWRDLTIGYDSATLDNKPELPVDATSQMLTFWASGRVRCTARSSGTEPKIKLYIEAREDSLEAAENEAKSARAIIIHDWFSPDKYGLVPADT